MTAYYNEFDPFAAAWLRNLIAAGHIAPGDVDERSIEDVSPDDLRPYTQCHFFAGIGVWSHALRGAGWRDDEPIWTGSCPCQPFSAAGKGGGFDDERHLWPAFFHLIRECDPAIVIGEQVASKDGLAWLDLVRADMEGTGRAFAAADLCAAGVGAPHIRQRSFWLADAQGARRTDGASIFGSGRSFSSAGQSIVGTGDRLPTDGLGDDDDARLEGQHRYGDDGDQPRRIGTQPARSGRAAGGAGGVAGTRGVGQRESGEREIKAGGGRSRQPRDASDAAPTNGFWRDADWLYCRDGKWRPVEPGTFPLAHGSANRVGRLRGYGNAIVAPVAQTFIEAVIEARRSAALLT